jgi:hypothetical protein
VSKWIHVQKDRSCGGLLSIRLSIQLNSGRNFNILNDPWSTKLVEALRYKPEGRRFDFCGVNLSCNRNE